VTPFEFAEKYLDDYVVRGGKILPEFCPICNGGENGDRHTFAIYQDETGRWVYKCQRASCPDPRGTFRHLAHVFNETESGIPVPILKAKKQQRSYTLPDPSKYSPPTEEIYAYFESRKISRATVDAFRIMSNSRGEIVFPFYEGDRLVYVKYRKPTKFVKRSNDDRKEMQEPNTKPILFGLDKVSYSDELIITEGQIDCMTLYEAGFRNVVSVPGGAQNEQWIDNNYEELQRFPSILLFGDGDEPGRKAMDSWAGRLDKARCRIVTNYPPRPDNPDKIAKDANEIYYFYGAEKLQEMVENAEEVTMSGLVDISTIPMHNPFLSKLVPSSLYKLNYEVGGYSPGDLVLWTGKTGEGKTTVVSQEILAAIESGERVVWYNAEIMPMKAKRGIIMQAAGSEYIGLEFDPRRDRNVPVVSNDVAMRIDEWLAGKLFLCTDTVAGLCFDTDYLIELFRYAKRRLGCGVVVVDNMMTALMSAPDETYNRAQEKFALALKSIATSQEMVVHLIAHPRKQSGQLTNDDVSGSASITRICDMNIAVSHGMVRLLKDRNEGYRNTEIPFIYYPDSKSITDFSNDVQLYCSWNREGIRKPNPPASTEYAKILPELFSCPI
jgi:KaiC/GvpD/RAD55 family RecA-like ATPase/5S rRNA maturation endonuclease (ribonuclease M5)